MECGDDDFLKDGFEESEVFSVLVVGDKTVEILCKKCKNSITITQKF